MRNTLLVLIGAVLFIGCSKRDEALPKITQNKKQLYEKAGWLIGSWGKRNDSAELVSTWRHLNDSTYMNKSSIDSRLTGKGWSEDTRIEERKGKIAMVSMVGEKEITFALRSATPDKLVFESTDPTYVEKVVIQNYHGDSISETYYSNGSKDGQRFVNKRIPQ